MFKLLKGAFLITSILCFVFCLGCVERFTGKSSDNESVHPITPEEIESIFASISAEITEKYPTETGADGQLLVFWLEGGSVWHESRSCGSVKNADPEGIFSGTVEEAIESGKERPCKICGDKEDDNTVKPEDEESDNDNTVPLSQEKDPDIVLYADTVVFWLRNGSVWHINLKCGALSDSDDNDIFEGTILNAQDQGKARGCKLCSSNVIIDEQALTACADESNDVETTVGEVITDKYPKEYDIDGELIVFWLDTSTIWHESRYCVSLSRSDPEKILSGSVSDAITSGKQRACKNCA